MSKELIVSASSQETKAAILEDGEVVELHVERERDKGIVGSICKGRVTKVLPGMQSAFVNIGLGRDAFLYVSDFFEDTEEYDRIVNSAEERVDKLDRGARAASVEDSIGSDEDSVPFRYPDRRVRSRRSRRGRLRGKRYEESPSESGAKSPPSPPPSPPPTAGGTEGVSVLPGESLAKYRTVSSEIAPAEAESGRQDSSNGEPTAAAAETGAPPLDVDETGSHSDPVPAEPGEGDAPEATIGEGQTTSSEELPQAAAETSEEAVQSLETPTSLGGPETTLEASSPESVEPDTVPEEVPPSQTVAGSADEGDPEEDPAASSSDGQQEPVATEVSATTESLSAEASAAADVATDESSELSPKDQSSKPEASARSEPIKVSASEAPPDSGTRSRGPKVQYRSRPSTPRFFRRSPDRRRQYHGEDRRNREASSPAPMIADLLKEGQEILIQISKEPLGTKGARITSHIALPGRYLVYMPTVDHIGVSRKIGSNEERQRLRKIILDNRGDLPGGFIIRTAGEYKGEGEFKSDIKFLRALWGEIKSQAEKASAPAIIHRELNLVQRILRDQLTKEFTTIRVDNELGYASIVELIHRFQPGLVNRVKLYTRETPIFEEFGVQAEVDKALRSKVWLKSGGYIVIDQAEALVAIDVNTGKYVGKSNKLEDTIAQTNLEAAREIARQLRLRDMGGIIVCDFIDMEDRKNRLKVTQTLEGALRREKSPSKVLQFNDFGLVAITRKRVKQSLLKALCEPCPECSGSGMVKSPQTVCYEIQGEARKMAGVIEDREMTVRVSPEVAKALKTTEASVIAELESSLKKDVVIKSDPLFPQERFDIF